MVSEKPPVLADSASARDSDPEFDRGLVRRMQSGDQRALGEFYDRWFPVVNGLVSRMVKSDSDTEDVVEETFWQAWRQADRFAEDRGSVQTWLLTIARSRSLDRLRSLKRRREESIDAVSSPASSAAAGVELALPPSSSDPLLATELQERSVLVRAALAALPNEQREALELGYFGGLSQSEIAERTGQPLGTVKTRMRLALHKLRDRLAVLREDTP
ncbi:MAG TPA: sigma-70 family RNA polymerase sigma factor [Gemmatimonadaceae bacterium]|jgi:RNA polymerase sigma-70 factor (ECF subfamily)